MLERFHPGTLVDGFTIGDCIHAGGNGFIYRASAPPDRDPGFAIVLKVPAIGRAQPTLSIVSFEMEQMILPTLSGPHVPRFVATGDLSATPYLAMEWIDGKSLAAIVGHAPLPADEVARVGAALADAVHSVHAQEVVHLDLKPENFLLRPDGRAVLLDFGFAHHAHYPDLLAEEKHFAAGSAPYVSPEQLQGDRTDARSDIFALGVLLYELATGEQPFGDPKTFGGMRDRLWREPVPPRAIHAEVPPWLQEVILRALHANAQKRYQSAAHLAFDLRHPDQVALSYRAERTAGAGFVKQLGRWWRARGHRGETHKPRLRVVQAAPVIMVAVDTEHPDDPRHPSLQWTTRQIISLNPEFRLMCVSVIRAAPLGEGAEDTDTASGKHLEHKVRLRQWIEPLRLPASRLSLHVVESANPGETLLDLAQANHVNLIVLGAPGSDQKKLAWWRSVASNVTANARCSVHVVRVPERNGDAAEG
jgi:nucleotide-binding universal stress UspA family protein